MQRTRVYIDGYNLYYGLIQTHRAHWLDLEAFSRRLNMGDPIDRVIYCTAVASSTLDDPAKAQRQDAYHRALRHACPNTEILYGQFQSNKKPRFIAGCLGNPKCAVRVVERVEKGSDVNLASRLLHDAHLNRFDRAIVVTGDSDLAEPIRLVVTEIGKDVWVRNPRDRRSGELQSVCSHYDRIRPGVAIRSQLPDPVVDGPRQYHKPIEWSAASKPKTRTVARVSPCTTVGCLKQVEIHHFK